MKMTLALLLFIGITRMVHAQEQTPTVESTPAPAPAPVAEFDSAAFLKTEVLPREKALQEAIQTVQTNANYGWTILCGALVFFMQGGFAMLELGFSRSKNVINIIMKNLIDFCTGSIAYLFLGFGLMFGATAGGFIGTSDFWLSSHPSTSPIWIFWMFQVVFAGTAATIASGAMAERTKFNGYLIYTVIISGLIYPILGHWAWGGAAGAFGGGTGQGWLAAKGFIDFAGSSVVHAIGGACALAGIIVVGPRYRRFTEEGRPRLIAGHNIPLAALGTFMLWFSWYGFNAGSTLASIPEIGRIAVNTTLSACAGSVMAMTTIWLIQHRPDAAMTLNGSLAGLVAITAGCANVSPVSAVLIGSVSGILVVYATIYLEKLQIDDVVGAAPVHLVNGIWGTIAVGIFHESGFDPHRLGIQTLGTLCIAISSFILSWIMFKTIDLTIGLRATEEEQINGLDFHEHAATAYPDFKTTDQKL
jgi:Amt family ammonium transporter